MKKYILTLGVLLISSVTFAQKKIVFTPQWVPQAQFSGFYVAFEKGFYKDEGLDVEIVHPSTYSTETPTSRLLSGKSDIVGEQLISSVISRSDGNPIINVMQLTQKSGLWCVSNNPISKPEDLDGLKIGKWRVGFSEFCDIMEFSTGIHIEWVPFLQGINLFVFGAVDATLCYSYNEFIALELAIGEIPEDHIIKFSDFGYNVPEDGLYVTENFYKKNKDAVDRFVKATKKGWDYTREHQEEALDITMEYIKDANVVTNKAQQKMMLEKYLALQINPTTGVADYAPAKEKDFNDLNEALLGTGNITMGVNYKDLIR